MDSDTMKTALKRCELFEGLDEGQMGVLVMRAVITQQDKRTVTIKTIEPTEILEWHVKDVEEGSPELLKRLKELAWKRMKYWNE